MPTALPLDALKMALELRSRRDEDVTGLVHHSDAPPLLCACLSAARSQVPVEARS